MEKFLFNLQRSRQCDLDLEFIKFTFQREMQSDYVEALNLMGRGNISQLGFDDICDTQELYIYMA